MYNDITVYKNSLMLGFFPEDLVEDMLYEYRYSALRLAEHIEWDEIILYAICQYIPETQTTLSADLMLLRMPYRRYLELYSELSKDCRLFFVRSREDGQDRPDIG
ncbi:MAG: hypothetical protein IJ874_03340 [Ruminococcus sp.]|nr:hypothetical protein [Ruminococcus sp.]